MTNTPVDIKRRDKLRFGFLKAIYDLEQKEQKPGMILSIDFKEAIAALGCTEQEAFRIATDLEEAGLIRAMGGTNHALTTEGREYIENHLHEVGRPWHETPLLDGP